MTVSERIAYLKGLAKGLDFDAESSKEAKMIAAMLDVLDQIAVDLIELEESTAALSDEVDELSEDLSDMEEFLCEDDEDDDDDDDETMLLEVKCPKCEKSFTIDEGVLDQGSVDCPNCGETLEFDLTDYSSDGCCCGCEDEEEEEEED